MKSVSSLIVLFSLFILVSAFALTDTKNDPKIVATNFLMAMKSKNYKKAKTFCTSSTAGVIDMIETSESPDPKTSDPKQSKPVLTIVDSQIRGDVCILYYSFNDAPDEIKELRLLNIEGKWLAELSKEDTDE